MGIYDSRHDKTNNVSVRPAKTQISLGIRPVWSDSSLSADAQADLSLRLAHIRFVGFVMSWLSYYYKILHVACFKGEQLGTCWWCHYLFLQVSGTLINYGFDLTFEVNETMPRNSANLSLGPLSYKYRISQIKVHFGSRNGSGSEHTIGGNKFDGEVRTIKYILYSYFSCI